MAKLHRLGVSWANRENSVKDTRGGSWGQSISHLAVLPPTRKSGFGTNVPAWFLPDVPTTPNPGSTGKSHLAQAIGLVAIVQGYRGLYRETHALPDDIVEATVDGNLRKHMESLATVPLPPDGLRPRAG